jgi:GABA(A) receptor-associated protein
MFLSDKKFIDKYSFFERNTEATKIIKRYPDRIPVICEKNRHDVSCPEIDKHKYLVPHDITVGQFIYVIRKRIRLPASSALFLFVGNDNTLLSPNTLISQAYHNFRNIDGFLYITYSKENVFG